MERVCFLLKVRKERLDEYKQRHQSVWAEMRQALHETGWTNYSLYLRDDGLLVGYLETPDFDAALRGMAAQEVNARWQREMAPFFIVPASTAPDQMMAPLEEIFHIDAI